MKGSILLNIVGFSILLWITRGEPEQALVWFGAALIGVLGVGYALEVWLSAHPTRERRVKRWGNES